MLIIFSKSYVSLNYCKNENHIFICMLQLLFRILSQNNVNERNKFVCKKKLFLLLFTRLTFLTKFDRIC